MTQQRSLWFVRLALMGVWGLAGGLVLVLSPNEVLPLVRIRFATIPALIWAVTGLILLLLAIALRPKPHTNTRIAGDLIHAAHYFTEGVAVLNAKGAVVWSNQVAEHVMLSDGHPNSAIMNLVERAQANQRVTLQPIDVNENLRYAIQAIPQPDGQTLTLLCRPIRASEERRFYKNFIHRIVHDMRNPLAAIIAHASNLQQSPSVDEAGWRKSASTIEGEAQRLARLVDSMLFDARLAYVPLQPQRLDLVDVLEEALFARDEEAMEHGKSIELEAPSGSLILEADRDLLVRAFVNIIDNSLKYSGPEGHVRIEVDRGASGYIIRFVDNGDGIPPEYLPHRIFEPLVRGRSQGSGSGLGLSITKKIIEMHQGSINASSEIGTGTTMTVRLPLNLIDQGDSYG
ncbi:MAG: HAMP domain-containing histidine kinase [Chloroflexi bacterium]|nr:HAMP domain-containing histidine kinase [Chloroflexota bacterium]